MTTAAGTMITFRWEGLTPSKKNSRRQIRLKSGRRINIPSKDYEAWHKAALWEVRSQMRRMAQAFPIAQCRACTLVIYYPDRRRHDNSNLWESVADLMVDAGVLADDCWLNTGVTQQIPELRPNKPGWELLLEIEPEEPRLI